MRLRTQKQPQVKKELCRALDDVDVEKFASYVRRKRINGTVRILYKARLT